MINKHNICPRRKRNRLRKWDYSIPHWYYVTNCTKNHREWFGKIDEGKMVLNEYGEIVQKQLLLLKKKYNYINLDEFIVMPNHFHGILVITENNIGAGRDLPENNVRLKNRTSLDLSLQNPVKIKSLSELFGVFKTTSSKFIHRSGLPDFSWQRSYYDHIIRNEKSLYKIRRYIRYNPLKWDIDKNNQINLKS